MAQALALAAPDGPRGVTCEDECLCGVIGDDKIVVKPRSEGPLAQFEGRWVRHCEVPGCALARGHAPPHKTADGRKIRLASR